MGFLSFLKSLFSSSQPAKHGNNNRTDISSKVNSAIDRNEIHPTYLKPLSNGLLPGEVILMNWIVGKSSDTHFPKYFSYTYGLDPEKSAAKLLKAGFITEANSIEALNSLKVTELKEILREHELKVSGKKQELIERIGEHLTGDEIDRYVTHKPLKMTEKGEQVIEHYYYIVPAHVNASQDGIYNVATAIEYVNEVKGTPNSGDISWALYQRALMKYYESQSYGLSRNVILNMAEQLQREKKPKAALVLFLEVFIMDMSGLMNGGMLGKPDLVIVAPGIVNYISNLLETLELDQAATKESFARAWDNIINSLPFHYLDRETCYECFLAAMNDDEAFIMAELNKSYESIDKATFEKQYPLKLM